MNFICSIFLTFFVVFRPLIPLVEYAVNYDYISQALCINKNKPDLHCNGKCYLSKELAKTANTDTFPSGKLKNSGQKLLDFYVLPEIAGITATQKPIFLDSGFLYEVAYSFLFSKLVFRPPVF